MVKAPAGSISAHSLSYSTRINQLAEQKNTYSNGFLTEILLCAGGGDEGSDVDRPEVGDDQGDFQLREIHYRLDGG